MNLHDFWNDDELDQLAMALTAAYKTNTTYKEPLDLADRVHGWRLVHDGDYTMDQILYGIKKHMKHNIDMVVPAHVTEILSPETPRITEAEFVAAQKYQERNNWPMMSDAQDIIDKYRKQNDEKRQEHKIECANIQQIVSQSVKRLS